MHLTRADWTRLFLLWLGGIDLRLTLLAVPPLIPLIHRELNLDGKAVAAYDTRVDMARILTGSAAAGIASGLRRAGARVVASDGSFLVKGKPAELEAGELARAAEWGRTLARTVAPEPVAAR